MVDEYFQIVRVRRSCGHEVITTTRSGVLAFDSSRVRNVEPPAYRVRY